MNKSIFLKNLLAIGFGFIISMTVFALFALIIITFPNAFKTKISDIVIFAVTSFTGGFLAASSASNFKIVCSIVTACLLLLILGTWMNFNFTNNSAQTFTLGLTCLVSGFSGGRLASMQKPKSNM